VTPSDRLDLARKIRSLAGRLEELAPELDEPRDGRQQGKMLELSRGMKALADAVADPTRPRGTPVQTIAREASNGSSDT
jgi:protoporphyrinogen oxidase